jgi:short-subunit dehydrogenase
VVPVELDVTNKEAIEKLGQQYPDVNLVINNSGHGYGGNSLTADPENAAKEMEINFLGPLRIVQSFEPILKKEGKNVNGSCSTALVTVGSIASFLNFDKAHGYGASKAAAHYLTDAHRRDLGDNTLVIGIYPGPIETDMTSRWDAAIEKATPASVADELLQALKEGKEHVFPDPKSKKAINHFLEQQNKALRQYV